MELTPDVVRQAEFGRAWGGYDMREVDAFLEQIGAGVDQLNTRMREVTARAERAEARGGGGLDDTIKRTLTLAQRAADLVVSEAKGVAERTTAEARQQAERIVATANDEAERITARSQDEGDRIVADHLERAQREHGVLAAQLRAERGVIEEQHREIREDVAALHAHAQSTRDRLRSALSDHLTRLDLLEFGDGPTIAASPFLPLEVAADAVGRARQPGRSTTSSTAARARSCSRRNEVARSGRPANRRVLNTSKRREQRCGRWYSPPSLTGDPRIPGCLWPSPGRFFVCSSMG